MICCWCCRLLVNYYLYWAAAVGSHVCLDRGKYARQFILKIYYKLSFTVLQYNYVNAITTLSVYVYVCAGAVTACCYCMCSADVANCV
jgi:hypothetical protein